MVQTIPLMILSLIISKLIVTITVLLRKTIIYLNLLEIKNLFHFVLVGILTDGIMGKKTVLNISSLFIDLSSCVSKKLVMEQVPIVNTLAALKFEIINISLKKQITPSLEKEDYI